MWEAERSEKLKAQDLKDPDKRNKRMKRSTTIQESLKENEMASAPRFHVIAKHYVGPSKP